MPRVRFVSPLQDLTAEVTPGTSLLDAAEAVGAQVGHLCGGSCACSTCHVYVKRGYDSLSDQDDGEVDRLDQAFDVKPSSRLACQATVGSTDVEIAISEESLTAWMDENPEIRRAYEAQGKWPLGAK